MGGVVNLPACLTNQHDQGPLVLLVVQTNMTIEGPLVQSSAPCFSDEAINWVSVTITCLFVFGTLNWNTHSVKLTI